MTMNNNANNMSFFGSATSSPWSTNFGFSSTSASNVPSFSSHGSFANSSFPNNNNNLSARFCNWSMDKLASAFDTLSTHGNRMQGIVYTPESGESDMDIDLEYTDELMEGVELSEEYDSLMDWECTEENDDEDFMEGVEYTDDLMEDVEYYDDDDLMEGVEYY
mmetsp:Transcript_490/g.1058  ORF Transcript_490/g.1058 Transcript_490/m.1058 type:complete len:163 (-) Transcript_490:600-1088(-)